MWRRCCVRGVDSGILLHAVAANGSLTIGISTGTFRASLWKVWT